MRILLASKHPTGGPRHEIGGVQSWCTTVGGQLQRQGHVVTYWSPCMTMPDGPFDVGIFANVVDTWPARRLCGRVLVVSHGIIPAEEPEGRPVAYTSEGVRTHWRGSGPVVRQPIDLEFWSPAPTPERPRYLTRFSYRRGLEWLPRVAERLGLQFRHVANMAPEQARAVIRASACVLATGRAALEAMACGVPVVICDHRSHYQGPLIDLDTLGAMQRNYSGRGGSMPTLHNVTEAVRAAMAAGSLRAHVEHHHDAARITHRLLDLATE